MVENPEQCPGDACGYALANKGIDTRTLQAYLGHRSIQSTVRYTELAVTQHVSMHREGQFGFNASPLD